MTKSKKKKENSGLGLAKSKASRPKSEERTIDTEQHVQRPDPLPPRRIKLKPTYVEHPRTTIKVDGSPFFRAKFRVVPSRVGEDSEIKELISSGRESKRVALATEFVVALVVISLAITAYFVGWHLDHNNSEACDIYPITGRQLVLKGSSGIEVFEYQRTYDPVCVVRMCTLIIREVLVDGIYWGLGQLKAVVAPLVPHIAKMTTLQSNRDITPHVCEECYAMDALARQLFGVKSPGRPEHAEMSEKLGTHVPRPLATALNILMDVDARRNAAEVIASVFFGGFDVLCWLFNIPLYIPVTFGAIDLVLTWTFEFIFFKLVLPRRLKRLIAQANENVATKSE